MRRRTAEPRDRAGRSAPPCGYWSGRRGSNPRPTAWKAVTLPLSYSRFAPRPPARCRGTPPLAGAGRAARPRPPLSPAALPAPHPRPGALARATDGGEGRIRTSEAARATDLQSVAFDRSATSPTLLIVPHPVAGARNPAGDRRVPGPGCREVPVFVLRTGPPPHPLDSPSPTHPARRYGRRRHPFGKTLPGFASVACGAGEGIRTPDPLITNQLLYRTELRQPDELIILAQRMRASQGWTAASASHASR